MTLYETYRRETIQKEYEIMLAPYKDRFAQQQEVLRKAPVHVDDYDYQHDYETEQAEAIMFNNLNQ